MNSYLQQLRQEGLTLVILKDDEILFESSGEGMRPLLEAIDFLGLAKLQDSIVVDKIVGKAAALLISYFKARETHCMLLSVNGRDVLDAEGVKHYSERIIPEIKNNLGTDICPFEKIVFDVTEPKEGFERLFTKLKSLSEC